jgi:4-hydroxybenzoate polyprenyltransferase
MALSAEQTVPPLCVNLDGTLIKSDVLLESLLLLVKKNPLYLFRALWWLLRGKAVLKAQISSRVSLQAATLPYDKALLEWLKAERSTGRSLWLCTAANELPATQIAAHLGLFDGVLASDGTTHLAGPTKADRLVQKFGAGGFDYCGNEQLDLAVWKCARGAIVVRGSRGLQRAAAEQTSVLHTFPEASNTAAAIIRTMRPHQWAKNVLILVPLLAAHLHDLAHAVQSVLAMVSFCLCASSVYVLNDLLDLPADRIHPRKSRRPFASGELSIAIGLALAPVLLAAAVALAALLPAKFQLVFATYYAVTVSYSFALKGVVLVDALLLASLYTLRIIAGAAATEVPLSFWLLLFAVFLFLSLAFVKRFAELEALRRKQLLRAAGRGYHVEDLPLLQSLGTAAGYLSVLILALYINSPDILALYHRPKFIWMLCVLLLYWISRVWMKAQRGTMHDDPVVFALKDRVSVAVGLLAVATVAAAI